MKTTSKIFQTLLWIYGIEMTEGCLDIRYTLTYLTQLVTFYLDKKIKRV
jgi:hypothetical protein